MLEPRIQLALLIAGFTLVSGVFDALAFSYSARIWQDDRLVWDEVAKAAISFGIGITMYWVAVRYLSLAGIVTPEIQTLLWFGVTMLGVAILGGRFFHWQLLEQVAAVNVLLSLGWLVSRSVV